MQTNGRTLRCSTRPWVCGWPERCAKRPCRGKWRRGRRIHQKELATLLGTSRMPVREALKHPESEGLVVIVPNSGVWIAHVDIAECVEMWKIRERIEPLALGESLPLLTDADIAGVEDICIAIENTTDIDEFLKLDRQFHLASYRSTAMPTLFQMIGRIWNATPHYRPAYTNLLGTERVWIIHCEHSLLMDAIKRHDIADAESALYSHIRRTRLEPKQNRTRLEITISNLHDRRSL